MKPSCFLAYYGFVVFLSVGTTSLFAQDTAVPKTTVAPFSIDPFRLAVVIETKKASGAGEVGKIQFMNTVLRSTTLSEKLPDGTARVRTARFVPETIVSQMPLAIFSLYDAKGNKLTEDKFLSRVKKGDVVLICEGGRLPDAKYLRVFKNDTLILVRGSKDIPPIPTEFRSGYMPNSR